MLVHLGNGSQPLALVDDTSLEGITYAQMKDFLDMAGPMVFHGQFIIER